MSWKKTNVVPPLPPEIRALLDTLNSSLGSVVPVLSTAKSLLEVAKVLYLAGTDLYSALLIALITECENIVNDTFGTGMYELIVDPFSVFPKKLKKDKKTGIPYVTPGDAINIAIASIDDLGDADRPQFSDSAEVAGFGIMLTAPDPAALLKLLEMLLKVWTTLDLKWTIERLKKAKAVAPIPDSISPDWSSARLNQIEIFAKLQKQLLDTLEMAKGYTITADQAVIDLIDALTQKVDDLKGSIEALQALMDLIKGISGMTDVFVVQIPLGVGGVNRIKAELVDADLATLKINKFTVMALYVAGGPSAAGLDNIRKVLFT